MNNEIKSLDDKDFEVIYPEETEKPSTEEKKIEEGHAVADRIAKLLARNAHKSVNINDK